MVDDPKRVTRRQMNAWARDFDSWAVCDTVCRAAFAMMAGQAAHDKTTSDERFLTLLPLIEKGAADDRNWYCRTGRRPW